MLSESFRRFSKISLLVGSLIAMIGVILGLIDGEGSYTALSSAASVIRIIGAMAASLGLPGVYLEIAKRVGKLGFVGFVFIFLFLLAVIGFEPVVAFVLPFLHAKAPELAQGGMPIGLFVFTLMIQLFILVGGILKGIAILRSGIPFRQTGSAILIGSLLTLAGNFVPAIPFLTDLGFILFFIGLVGLAVAVWSEQPVSEFQSVQNQSKINA